MSSNPMLDFLKKVGSVWPCGHEVKENVIPCPFCLQEKLVKANMRLERYEKLEKLWLTRYE